MKILLTGEPHSGKSTLLERLVAQIERKQGLLTKEVSEGGERVGFKLVSSVGTEADLASIHIDSDRRVSRYGVDVVALDRFLEQLPPFRPDAVLYIDEIGEMQLMSEKFQSVVEHMLGSKNDFIGTLSKVYMDDFINSIRSNQNLEIIEVTKENRDELYAELKKRITT